MDLNEFKAQLEIAKTTLDEKDVDRVLTSALKRVPENKNNKGTYNLIIVMEELAELTQQVSKYIRRKADRYCILEELADVYLAARYVKNIVGISDEELNAAINVKKNRQDKKNKLDEEFKSNELAREGCFYCGYLGKEKVECTADKSVKLNPFLLLDDVSEELLDEVSEDCPKKKGVIMEYKGFTTTNIEKREDTTDENNIFSAKVINSADFLEITANELEDMEPKFHKVIDDYIELCNLYGKNPYQK